ncbi:FKBP-type peptidyl-prolyl cis-trans isomerase [Syntrophorhabdus aromaticivorans]|jgi:FKBP-type peptidyl-prolyl cis-trans isomerase|uniref:Peptidyl-prolyl cis-trans isomerase n=1 Tax=Syntrophorhabdus aromaticivorans TaxID=328301 RepID=A0A351U118_9BACT|nr:FKBP-type peptidyl-prolyl cis-trans isomerase [Syntrophorhabdus aromaticivorans]NLW35313.1 FKBP-type peptidyl-prolyl cis-trans isomerase [Syntrophorhabdus aromaticivorans]HBA53649.1 FKBP-type peptidyl-prolyl cis-trans isomerase [Syntrophorhabdus aromaticivorans]
MRFISVIFIGILLLASQAFGADEVSLKTQKDKASYTIGVNLGKGLRHQAVDIDTSLMMKGLNDSLSGGKTLLTDQEMRDVMVTFQKDMAAKLAERRKVLGEKNKKEGEAFLAENKKKPGVKTLSSGLQYKVLKEGKGKTPTATDTVVTHYRGTLIDGTEFDSSFQRKEPAAFAVRSVIKGWTEALQLMREGAKWQLFVPSDLAYGDRGAGPLIGPNATLIFEVELISVNPGNKEQGKQK